MSKRYWFAAKDNGVGWSLPMAWEGWAAVAIFLAAGIAAYELLQAPAHLIVVPCIVLAFVGLVVLKGEPQR
jgi:hypothetical protein